MHRIKKLVAFKNAKDRHRVVYTFAPGTSPQSNHTPSATRVYVDVLHHVNNLLGDNSMFIDLKMNIVDWWTTEYRFIFDVMSGIDGVMLKLHSMPHCTLAIFPYKTPERYPGEYSKRYKNVVHSGTSKHKHKGHK
jgi:hypothetical protein